MKMSWLQKLSQKFDIRATTWIEVREKLKQEGFDKETHYDLGLEHAFDEDNPIGDTDRHNYLWKQIEINFENELPELLQLANMPKFSIFRLVWVDDIKQIVLRDNIGTCWTTHPDPHNMYFFGTDNKVLGKNKFILKAQVSSYDVDWWTTLKCRLQLILGEDEAEIRLVSGSHIYVKSIIDTHSNQEYIINDKGTA